VDGFDQDEAESKRDERAVILRRLLASKCDTLEAFELADSLFNACPCLVELVLPKYHWSAEIAFLYRIAALRSYFSRHDPLLIDLREKWGLAR
jgi:hypothetical protein